MQTHDIQQILDSQIQAWAAGDAAAFVADFAADATFVSVRGDLLQGRDAIESNHAFIFNGPYKGTRIRETPEHLRLPAPDVAVAHVAVEVSNIASFPPGVAPSGPGMLRTSLLFVFVFRDDRWQITSAQNTIVIPQPVKQ